MPKHDIARRFAHLKSIDSLPFPRWTTIGHITSIPLSLNSRFGPPGVYELSIEIDENILEAETSPFDYVKHVIAQHLAGCAANTGVPLKEGAWIVKIEPEFRRRFPQLPQEFRA